LTRGSENHKLRGIGLLKTMLQYVLFRTGPLSHAVFEMSAFFKTSPGSNRPDAMFQFSPASATIDKVTGSMVPEKLPGASFSAYIVRPKSRGYMTITSADPDAPAIYDPAYFTHPDDRKAYAGMVHRLREFVSHPALKPFGFEEVSPGPSVQTEDEIIEYALKNGSYAVHALGTCRMGADAESVVDPELRVRGVEGLRIADISVLPEMVSSHTNAPAMMIGWRAGQIINAAHAGG
jgi:choline dehydrogenase-like flavoprotein